MIRRSSFAFLVAVALLLAACGPKGQRLTRSDSGGQLQVNAGEQFRVELPSNPSTGFNWEPQDLDATMFELVGEPAMQYDGQPAPGQAGTLILTFKALKAGTAVLTLVYHRSWEDVEPADTFSVTVTVK